MSSSSSTSAASDTIGFGIDRGGTFTDVFVVYPNGEERTFKLLSEDPENYGDAPTEAIRRVIEEYTKQSIPKGQPIPTKNIGWIRMGTTVATNALLERKGEPTALVVTKGFKDLLFIGNQSRPKIFDLNIEIPDCPYQDVVEVDERVLLRDETCEMQIKGRQVETTSGKKIIVEKELDLDSVEKALRQIKSKGIESLAVLFMHSYIFSEHESKVGELAKRLGFSNVSLSSEVIPMIKVVPRGYTTVIDAYLTPVIQRYIQSFRQGFQNELHGVVLEFMQSDGGLCPIDSFIGSRAILSGPAGGVVGVSLTAYDNSDSGGEERQPVIGFDMGGTSTDVSRYDGQFEHVFDSVTAGITVQAPQLDINTVAAGGGSRLFFRQGLFVVGPESAGSNPGPVCYRKGGYLTITDANVVLGRILPEFFPHIFGPNHDQALDKEGTLSAFQKLTDEVNKHLQSCGRPLISVHKVALGFIQVANETMCRPIRRLTEGKGYDTQRHVLSCFGGAGGQHACAIARNLGMRKVRIHKHAGVLSAYGLVLADVVDEHQEPWMKPLDSGNDWTQVQEVFRRLEQEGRKKLTAEGFSSEDIHAEHILHLRYDRTDCALSCSLVDYSAKEGDESELKQFKKMFLERYQREFGFTIPDRPIIIDDIRARVVGRRHLAKAPKNSYGNTCEGKEPKNEEGTKPKPKTLTKCYFTGTHQNDGDEPIETGVYLLNELIPGNEIRGPAIIIDKNCTVLVEPNCIAKITTHSDIEITLDGADKDSNGHQKVGTAIDPIQLSIFSNRFMSIAEQMGSALQRSAISTNIKERLDFSCAIFDRDGGLVANAPHIPVHLGGMQYAVKFQIDHIGLKNFHPGDVILSNHPKAGGSHLPDLTVITPVFFSDDSSTPDFFVANRGHHSDIGGLCPGSMPPNSRSLAEEGAQFLSFPIIARGEFQEKALVEALNAPEKVPNCSGTRNLRDNLADLHAQVAANQKGISLLRELVKSYSLPVVQAYMAHIQANAESAVRTLLRGVAERERNLKNDKKNAARLESEDRMDDGTVIKLAVEIDPNNGDATFDFTGTGLQVCSNCNTPPAVLMAAIIYCLRCLVAQDIPLNQGCLAPIKVIVPPSCILNPDDDAAIVGGNVLTSQRLCDVIFRAFEACAAAQGCMNNITFGDASFGYYETVAGGAGAGPNFRGRSGIHTHMTNTRITDPEIIEFRYPVILREFSLREGSAGAGQNSGGDGIVRRIQFRRPLHLSVLTERRVFPPWGLAGGSDAKTGRNTLVRASNGSRVNLGGKVSVPVRPGDIFELETPGGGGFGSPQTTSRK